MELFRKTFPFSLRLSHHYNRFSVSRFRLFHRAGSPAIGFVSPTKNHRFENARRTFAAEIVIETNEDRGDSHLVENGMSDAALLEAVVFHPSSPLQ